MSLMTATVTNTGPTKVTLDGGATAVDAPYHNSFYTPAVNDRVVVEEYRGTLFIHGKEATG